MNNILRDEVNQHTSDEVAKVLADLEAQGVDLAAIKEALANAGSSGMKVKSFQRGEASYYSAASNSFYMDVTINEVDVTKSLPIVKGMAAASGGVLGDGNVVARLIGSKTLRLHFSYKRSASSCEERSIPWWVIEFE